MVQQVLITGGSEGIGRGLAERFHARGARVLVTGRSQDKLAQVARTGIETLVSDIGLAADREALAAHVRAHMPALDLVINNAGLQRRVSHAEDHDDWPAHQREIDVLLAGPIHLNQLLVPVLLAHRCPARIVNVSSGGAFVPQVFAPLYSACKAAIHSHTVTLRHALAETAVRVVELVPPAVQTSLAGGVGHGVPLDAFCDAVLEGLAGEHDAIGFGPTAGVERLSQAELRVLFERSASRFATARFKR